MAAFVSFDLGDATGHGIRIAVIDSGVHTEHPHVDAARVEGGVVIGADGSIAATPPVDKLGHGTAVTAAIQEMAPGAICLPVQVFATGLKTTTAAIVSAIRWATAQGVDIINLSLGSRSEARREVFARVAAEASAAGAIIVSARSVDDTFCFPGALPDVIGVELDWECPRGEYGMRTEGGGVVIKTSGFPRPIPGVPQQRNLHGVSFAVAQVSGFTARAVEVARARSQPQTIEAVAGILLESRRVDD